MSDLDAIRSVLAAHTPVDTSGGSDAQGGLIFCGGHDWHTEHEGWQSWIDHVAPLVHAAVLPQINPEGK